jgi:hypothetical protein
LDCHGHVLLLHMQGIPRWQTPDPEIQVHHVCFFWSSSAWLLRCSFRLVGCICQSELPQANMAAPYLTVRVGEICGIHSRGVSWAVHEISPKDETCFSHFLITTLGFFFLGGGS